MKKAKFLASHFDAGVEKFKAGQAYPLTDETRLCIARGAAVEVDVEETPEAAPAPAGETELAEAAAAPVAEAASAPAPAPTAAPKKK